MTEYKYEVTDEMLLDGFTNFFFLGGACNPTTWREDIAIPFLEKHRVYWYNPQKKDWKPSDAQMEQLAKVQGHHLFVVSSMTRGLVSLLEVVAGVLTPSQRIVVVMEHMLPGLNIPYPLRDEEGGKVRDDDGNVIMVDQVVGAKEASLIEDARQWVWNLMEILQVPHYRDVGDGLNAILYEQRRERSRSKRYLRSRLGIQELVQTINLGNDICNVVPMLESMAAAFLLGEQISLEIPYIGWLEGQKPYGFVLDGRSFEDWSRIYEPYAWMIAMEAGVNVIVFDADGQANGVDEAGNLYLL